MRDPQENSGFFRLYTELQHLNLRILMILEDSLFQKIDGIDAEILEELELCKRTTYKNLSHRFFVSISTVRRSIRRIGQLYPIIRFQGKDGGIELDRKLYGLPNHIRELIIKYLKSIEEKCPNDRDLQKCLNYIT